MSEGLAVPVVELPVPQGIDLFAGLRLQIGGEQVTVAAILTQQDLHGPLVDRFGSYCSCGKASAV
ncbi:hypothetical protein GCM10012280_64700 [Wenjunlia tyrosinilytica]|uniref:Uncharacterized protein n=1 Tax=Wenjunlia tyrosinilytica TaxID=1544741 RepID=A0A917ZZT5_9ACTN|nr:hypothetical protein GCM10012280_64700 [Wenjunlia tyrosinilytica]